MEGEGSVVYLPTFFLQTKYFTTKDVLAAGNQDRKVETESTRM
jgi:hypothetical protein